MNPYLAAAAILAFIVGLAHSVLGEFLVFRRLRASGIVPTDGGTSLKERQLRIVWASWHILTVLGWCVAAILWWLARQESLAPSQAFITRSIAAAMLVSGLLVLVATRARHPGWIGLFGVAILATAGERIP